MKKLNKKGFTIIELVIVVAVIAILSAVLIPTFVGVINKANQSADETAVRNMNTILAADGAVEPTDVYELFDVLAENGIEADDYTPLYKDRFFFWDSAENMVVYTDKHYDVLYPEKVGELDQNNWVSLTGKIYTKDVDVSDLIYNTEAEVGDAAEFLAVVEAINAGKKSVKDVTTIVLTDDFYNFMGAELAFAGKTGKIGGTLTIKAEDDVAVLNGIANIDATSVGANDNGAGTKTREYNSAIIPHPEDATITFENITVKNSVFGSDTTTLAAVFVGNASGSTVNFKNVTVEDVEIKALAKTGTFVAQAYGATTLNIDADCAATNVNIDVTIGLAGKVFGAAVTQGTNVPTVTIADGADVAGDTVKVNLVRNSAVKYYTAADNKVYAQDLSVVDGAIKADSTVTEYYATVANYGFVGVRSVTYEDVDSTDAVVLNKYNCVEWTAPAAD